MHIRYYINNSIVELLSGALVTCMISLHAHANHYNGINFLYLICCRSVATHEAIFISKVLMHILCILTCMVETECTQSIMKAILILDDDVDDVR